MLDWVVIRITQSWPALRRGVVHALGDAGQRLQQRTDLPVPACWRSQSFMTSNSLTATDTQARRSIVRAALRWGLGLVLGASSLVLIAWLTLHWGILPHIQQWRSPIEQRLGAALGVPVRIGSIEVRSGRWVPALEMRDVVLLDAQQREALRLRRVVATLALRSAFVLEPHFRQLLIEAPELELRRDARGRIFVAGFAVDGSAAPAGDAATDWLFSQREIAIRGGSLRWIDETRTAAPLMLSDVDLVLRNGLQRRELRLDATPPEGWGERFTMRAQLRRSLLERRGDWRRWSGTLYAELPYADVRQLQRHVELPLELTRGEGALRAWLDIDRGQVRAATADMALRSVQVRAAPALEPLALDRLTGRIGAERSVDGVRLAATQLAFATAEGLEWPAADLGLTWRHVAGTAGRPAGGEFKADRLDLALMASIAARLPLGERLSGVLADLAPRGIANGVSFGWDGALDAPTRYQARARVAGLSIASALSSAEGDAARPGLSQAAIEFTATERGGEADLEIVDGTLEFPGVFADPRVPVGRLATRLAWRIEPAPVAGAAPHASLQVRGLKFANDDIQGHLDALWRSGAGPQGNAGPGVLDMSGRLEGVVAARVARYLPLSLAADTRRYVELAVRDGRVAGADFKLRGDLREFPFRDARRGEFRVAARLQDLAVDYAPVEPGQTPRWPGFREVNGELVFERGSMAIRNASARLGEYLLGGIDGSIADLNTGATLQIEGRGRGPLAELLRFINASPVGDWTDRALLEADGQGITDLAIALRMPLADTSNSTVRGSITLAGNELRIRPDLPRFEAARGRVDFDEQGFAVVGAGARVLGSEIGFGGGTQPDGSVRFSGQGVVDTAALQRAAAFVALPWPAGRLSGQTPVHATLGFVQGRAHWQVDSDLVGLSSRFPAPLDKAADAAMPLRLQIQPLPVSPGSDPRELLSLDIGEVLRSRFVREHGADATRLLRGGIGVMAQAPEPDGGVQALLNLGAVDFDAWRAVMVELAGASPTPGSAAPTDGDHPPTRVGLRAERLTLAGRELTHVVAGASRVDGVWRVGAEADQLGGYAEWRGNAIGAPGHLYARLSRLTLPPGESESVESLLDRPSDEVPTLDIVVDDLELRGMRLGRVEVAAASRPLDGDPAAAHEWRLTRLAMSTPDAKLEASGQWLRAQAGQRRSALDFQLDLVNGGAFLARLGTPDAVRGGKGRLSGKLAWVGSPLALDLPSLEGDVKVAIDAGRFLKADAGAGRLLSVLSLQSLARRLSLDFRDVFREGFAFDNLSGDLAVTQGVARTNNLRMRGAQAAVLMEGSADLARETQDLRVVVVPEIDASTASLAYAVINPAIGLGTFLAQWFLRRPLMQAGTREFHVTGGWADPKVERVERSAGAVAPGADVSADTASPPAAAEPEAKDSR